MVIVARLYLDMEWLPIKGGVPPRPSTAVGNLVILCPYLLPGTGKQGLAANPEVASLETVNSH